MTQINSQLLKGNASYFLSSSAEVRVELEDVMTIHIMEDDGSGTERQCLPAR